MKILIIFLLYSWEIEVLFQFKNVVQSFQSYFHKEGTKA